MKSYLIISLTFLFYIVSCNKDNGEVISKQVSLSTFDTIHLNDFFDVFLIEDSVYQLRISANENLMNHIKYEVVGSELRISNDKKLKWTDPKNNKVSLYIHSKGLKEVHANETCNIQTINPITTPEFGIILKSKANYADLQFDNQTVYYWNNHPCGGLLNLSGKTKELKLWNFAIMSVDASNLTCNIALVENSSKGNCKINVTEQLKYSIKGEGDIIVFGNPTEIISEGANSSGKLVIL